MVDLRTLRYFVVVVEEANLGRAAARLRMTQPPLTRAIRALEDELGAALLTRTPRGVDPTPAGVELHRRAVDLLHDAELLPDRVQRAAGAAVVTIGTLADSTDHLDPVLTEAVRRTHPHIEIRAREYDLADPTAGLRSAETDLAFTRLPFTTNGLSTQHLATEAVGVLVSRDDPLAHARTARLDDLADRDWVRLPPDADPVWRTYWTGGPSSDDQPTARTIQECVQGVLWSRRLALAPIGQTIPPALTIVPTSDRPPSQLVVAWSPRRATPAIRAYLSAVRTR